MFYIYSMCYSTNNALSYGVVAMFSHIKIYLLFGTSMSQEKSPVFIKFLILLWISIFSCSSYADIGDDSEQNTYLNTLLSRVEDEKELYSISEDLFKKIENDTNSLLESINSGASDKLIAKNYLLEQLTLQSEKLDLQSKRIQIDRESIEQEIIAEENTIYHLDNKLQTLVSGNKGLIKDDEILINRDIKNLQAAISYHKSILDLNKKRLDILKSHSVLIEKIKANQNNKLNIISKIVDENLKQKKLVKLSKKELEINKEIQKWLEREMSARQSIRALDFKGYENKHDQPEYNKLRERIVEAIHSRGLLELELGFLRLNSRFIDVSVLFDLDNKDVLKNKKYLAERVERIRKEAISIQQLVNNKLAYINSYKIYTDKEKRVKDLTEAEYTSVNNLLNRFKNEYNEYKKNITIIVGQINHYSQQLKDLYLKDVSIRQNMPESWIEWQSLGSDIISIPYLISKQSLVAWLQFTNYFNGDFSVKVLKLIFLQMLIFSVILVFYRLITFLQVKYHQLSIDSISQSASYIITRVLSNNKNFIVIFSNIYILCWFTGSTGAFVNSFFLLSILYLLISTIIMICYIFLIENTMGISGDDSRLYKGLKYSLIFGGVIYVFMILGHALNLSINTLSFFDRIFMLFLLAVSYPLIMNWQVVPQLLIDGLEPKPYVRKVIWLLGIIVPVTILSNAALGIIGYVNLAWAIAVAEFQLSLVIALWLIAKGLLSELMDFISRFFIRNVTNGWLWTESVLKPLHSLLSFILLLVSILGLIFIYGLNSNADLLSSINNFISYSFDINLGPDKDAHLKISIKDLIIFCIIFAIVIWATKWSREFSYRWLYSKTKDLAVRNSFSVFTQYATLLFGIIIILKVLGIPTATLMVTVGGLLFFLGFGLRDIISNYISGIILLIERPVRAGDFVTIGEFEGKITKIGMRSLTVQSFDNMEVIVPNTDTITKPLINWTFNDTVIRMDLELRVCYEENLERVREIIFTIFESNEEILDDPMPRVYFKEFSDSAIIVKIYYYIDLNKTPSRGAIRTTVMLDISKKLSENGVKVAYPRQSVELQNN